MTDVSELTPERNALPPGGPEPARTSVAANKPLLVSNEQLRLAFIQHLYPERATYQVLGVALPQLDLDPWAPSACARTRLALAAERVE